MKHVLMIMLLCSIQNLFASQLVANDGTVFQNVIIISADPVRMLIVHDGGGCQVEYSDLAPNTLSSQQRETVAVKIAEYVERQAKYEQLKLEQKTFEQAQRGKGLILFEDNWMKPAEREDMLARRELKKLERERLLLELELQKAELRQERALAEQNERLLEPPRQTSSYYYGYYRPCRSRPEHHKHGGRVSGCGTTGGPTYSFTSSPNSVYLGSRSSCQSSMR